MSAIVHHFFEKVYSPAEETIRFIEDTKSGTLQAAACPILYFGCGCKIVHGDTAGLPIVNPFSAQIVNHAMCVFQFALYVR